jgi:hypothetical protein
MRTCLSSFSDFFKGLACVPHDIPKNIEPASQPVLLIEAKKEDPLEPVNALIEAPSEGALEEVYDEKCKKHSRASSLEACIILAPLIIGVFYSYMLSHLSSS